MGWKTNKMVILIGYTLWLCQNSYWKWALIVDFPWKMVISHSYVSLPEGKSLLRFIKDGMQYPIWSMYGIFTYIWVIFRANVGTYSSTMEHMGIGNILQGSQKGRCSYMVCVGAATLSSRFSVKRCELCKPQKTNKSKTYLRKSQTVLKLKYSCFTEPFKTFLVMLWSYR